MRQVRQLLI